MKFNISKPFICALAFSACMITGVAAGDLQLPSFLPAYYSPVFSSKGVPLVLRAQRETNGVSQFVYSLGANESLLVENFNGESSACRAGFNNILGHLNQVIATNKGSFVEITETEFHAVVRLTNVTQTIFAFLLPHSVNIWTRSVVPGSTAQFGSGFPEILSRVNQQRYEDAFKEGNVSLGQWQKSGQNYANELLKAGKTNDALIVLRNVLATAPFN